MGLRNTFVTKSKIRCFILASEPFMNVSMRHGIFVMFQFSTLVELQQSVRESRNCRATSNVNRQRFGCTVRSFLALSSRKMSCLIRCQKNTARTLRGFVGDARNHFEGDVLRLQVIMDGGLDDVVAERMQFASQFLKSNARLQIYVSSY